jgi:signal transduction histidine kinase/ligand-binding sensor domain-containing protein/DNA-binding response OmpR family regulator
LEDEEGQLWIGTSEGLYKFNPQTKKFLAYLHDPKDPKSVIGNNIKALFKDSRGNLWVGAHGSGLSLLHAATNSFINFYNDEKQANSLCQNDILSLNEDDGGNLWIGTENGGLAILDYKHQTFSCHTTNPNDGRGINNNSIYSIYKDDHDNLWVGTYAGGINFLPRYGKKFTHLKQIPGRNSLINNNVLSLGGDSDGNLWIGTDGGGLDRFQPGKNSFTHFIHDPKNVNTISSNVVFSIIEVDPQTLAIGYLKGGFDLYGRMTGTFTHHLPEKGNTNSLSNIHVITSFKDRFGKLWFGSPGSPDGALTMFDVQTKKFKHYRHNPNDPKSLSHNGVPVIYEDRQGSLWVGTEDGLNLFDRETETFKRFKHNPRNSNSLSNDLIFSLYEDTQGNFWVGTSGGGLNLLDRKTETFKQFSGNNDLSYTTIYGILEDAHGYLWLSTNNGISKFDTRSKLFRNYDITDGVQGNEFRFNAAYKTADGVMYFGGPNGLNAFHPDSIKDNPIVPPVHITNFQIFNKDVHVGEKESPLHRDIEDTHKITLSYKQSVFSFDFAALNFIAPQKNQYAYKMEGFDKEWILTKNLRKATYTNLNPGTYTFKVKASNNDGLWNEKGAAIQLVITPPYWKTWWFIMSLLLLIAGFVYVFIWARMRDINRIKSKLEQQVKDQTAAVIGQKEALEAQAENMFALNDQLQAQTDFLTSLNDELNSQKAESVAKREEAEKARQDAEKANQAKSIFLATMSHEIRTPMNGVLGMASLLAETTLTEEQQEYTDTIRSSGEALLTVINDILDFSKIESGNLELDNHSFDLRQCVEEVMDLFAGKSAQKKIDLVYQIDYQIPAQISGDSHRLRQILINLMGNAMKFTHQGEIFVGIDLVKMQDKEIELAFHVRDTGIGIPEDKISRLFKAFSQVDSSTTRKYGGTGLGLIISQRLVELMGGVIWVESKPGLGTTFSFTLKTMISQEIIRQYVHYSMEGNEGKNVLVIDDNLTNLTILKSQLELWKLVPVLASSGPEALVLLMKQSFDLVITDMQMPEMDGIQLAQKIKAANEKLPVILLSSVGDESRKKYPELFFSILNKPVKQHQLYRDIQQALRPYGTTKGSNASEQKTQRVLSEDFAKKYPLKIMLAEDNPVNQKLTIRVLNKLGYGHIEVAQNGLEAVEKFHDAFYDVILMDVQMPEMDGLEATRLIRAKHYHQPVIISMTANATQADRDVCIQAGMNDFISKPIKLEDLLHALEKACERIMPSDEAFIREENFKKNSD